MTISGECVNCKWYDPEEHTCKNKAGFYYKRHDFHPADTFCDMWQACKQYEEEMKQYKEEMNRRYKLKTEDMVANPWLRWKERKQKELLHE